MGLSAVVASSWNKNLDIRLMNYTYCLMYWTVFFVVHFVECDHVVAISP